MRGNPDCKQAWTGHAAEDNETTLEAPKLSETGRSTAAGHLLVSEVQQGFTGARRLGTLATGSTDFV